MQLHSSLKLLGIPSRHPAAGIVLALVAVGEIEEAWRDKFEPRWRWK
jgi:hypothetical protein